MSPLVFSNLPNWATRLITSRGKHGRGLGINPRYLATRTAGSLPGATWRLGFIIALKHIGPCSSNDLTTKMQKFGGQIRRLNIM